MGGADNAKECLSKGLDQPSLQPTAHHAFGRFGPLCQSEHDQPSVQPAAHHADTLSLSSPLVPLSLGDFGQLKAHERKILELESYVDKVAVSLSGDIKTAVKLHVEK
eukprot:7370430-Karenia_brevis.AAC.1